MGTSIIEIRLTQEHTDYSDLVARRRWEHAAESDIPNPAPPEKQQWRDILGARCECAAYLWLRPVDWYRGRRTDLPDLHDFIDVKGVGKAHHNLLVKPDNPTPWAYLLVLGHDHPVYYIDGWKWGREAKTYPLVGDTPPCHLVPRGDLIEPHMLELVLRERQEFPERSLTDAMV